MKLPVLPETIADPWYKDGLRFTCTQCGNCCTGGPGFVWISRTEILRLAEHLNISPADVVERYCRKISGRWSLKESRNPATGAYDCIFLKEIPAKIDSSGNLISPAHRGCEIYPVRPLQCRTWPFWPEVVASPETWKRAGRNCPGIDQGRTFDRQHIEATRDATDWPRNPPSSASIKMD